MLVVAYILSPGGISNKACSAVVKMHFALLVDFALPHQVVLEILADFSHGPLLLYHNMSASPAGVPSNEEQVELLLSCRYGDLEDVQEFVKKFGPGSLTKIRDDNGNTVLHMICGNGHSGESPIVQSLDIESHSSKIFGRYPWFPGAGRAFNALVCPK
jgi:hypothetical protein